MSKNTNKGKNKIDIKHESHKQKKEGGNFLKNMVSGGKK